MYVAHPKIVPHALTLNSATLICNTFMFSCYSGQVLFAHFFSTVYLVISVGSLYFQMSALHHPHITGFLICLFNCSHIFAIQNKSCEDTSLSYSLFYWLIYAHNKQQMKYNNNKKMVQTCQHQPLGIETLVITLIFCLDPGILMYDREATGNRWWQQASQEVRDYFGKACFIPTDKRPSK